MKILTFSDSHGSLKAIREVAKRAKKGKVSLIICGGDITIFEENLREILSRLNKIKIPVFLIHGNHESEKRLRNAVKGLKNVKFLHKKTYRRNKTVFMFYGGGGFALRDPEFVRWAKGIKKKIKKDNKVVLVLHGPPYGTKLDLLLNEQHCGNKDFAKFIKKQKPSLVIAGHIHECEGADYKVKKTRFVNPGPFGKVIEI